MTDTYKPWDINDKLTKKERDELVLTLPKLKRYVDTTKILSAAECDGIQKLYDALHGNLDYRTFGTNYYD